MALVLNLFGTRNSHQNITQLGRFENVTNFFRSIRITEKLDVGVLLAVILDMFHTELY